MSLPGPQVKIAGHDEPDEEAAFKSALKDVAAFCRVMAAHCSDVTELAEIAEAAISNRGQLSMLASIFRNRTK